MDLVDPELRKRYRLMGSVPVGNRWIVKLTRVVMPLAPKAKVPDDVRLEVIRGGNVDGLRVYTPVHDHDGGETRGALLWIHGGGMMIGAASQDDARCFEMVRELDIVVVSAEYRLAPEHPFPAPLDDCFEAWTWLHAHAAERGIDPTRVAVGGQSAGGGLAASLAQRLHDAAHDTGHATGVVEPIAQWLFCPMLDDRTAADRALDSTKHLLWNNKSNRSGWSAYLGVAPGAPAVPEFAVPSRRSDLGGLAPAWIGTGDIELFYEENRSYAEALQAAGVECVLDVVGGAPHAFESLGADTNVARAYLDRSFTWLRSKLDR
jgi:acetyl esterase/lipase